MTEEAPDTTDTAQAPDGQDTAATETETEVKAEAADWRAGLPEELRDNPNIQKHTTTEGLAGAYVNAVKMIGGDKIAVPKDDATWDAFYKAGGRPDEATGYELKVPEGLPEGVYVPESAEAFKTTAHALGLNAAQAAGLHDWFVGETAGGMEQSEAALAASRESATTALRKEWGGAFEARTQSAVDIVAELGGEDFGEYLVSSGLGNDPRAIKMFAKVAEALKGDKALVGNGDLAGADIQGQIADYRTKNNDALYNAHHPEHNRALAGLTRLTEKAYPEQV